jgi:hypothetical protein
VTEQTCTAYWRTREGQLKPWVICGKAAPYEVADTFFCEQHYRGALQWAETVMRCRAEAVYYTQRADGLIKIGTSRTAGSRLADLAREHGPLILMALQGGGRTEEAAVHRAFKALRVEGEWFRPALPLLEHIVKVRQVRGNLEPESAGLPPQMSRRELGRMVAQLRRETAA